MDAHSSYSLFSIDWSKQCEKWTNRDRRALMEQITMISNRILQSEREDHDLNRSVGPLLICALSFALYWCCARMGFETPGQAFLSGRDYRMLAPQRRKNRHESIVHNVIRTWMFTELTELTMWLLSDMLPNAMLSQSKTAYEKRNSDSLFKFAEVRDSSLSLSLHRQRDIQREVILELLNEKSDSFLELHKQLKNIQVAYDKHLAARSSQCQNNSITSAADAFKALARVFGKQPTMTTTTTTATLETLPNQNFYQQSTVVFQRTLRRIFDLSNYIAEHNDDVPPDLITLELLQEFEESCKHLNILVHSRFELLLDIENGVSVTPEILDWQGYVRDVDTQLAQLDNCSRGFEKALAIAKRSTARAENLNSRWLVSQFQRNEIMLVRYIFPLLKWPLRVVCLVLSISITRILL